MANMDIKTPKFFTDFPNFLMATGTAQNGNFDVMSGSDLINTFNAGSEAELFDMKPMNQVHFETSGSSAIKADHVLINIDLGSSAFNCDYVAILNHNMKSSKAKVRVAHSDTEGHVQAADMGSATACANMVEVVNADSIANNVVEPATDGSTIFTFDSSDDQYWGIQFEGTDSQSSVAAVDGSFDGTYDLKIGCVLVGESYTMPNAPDLSVKRTIIYDGVDVQQSVGGQKYGNATHLGRRFTNARSKSPFATSTFASGVYGGRIIYDLNFSYLSSSDVMPSAYDGEVAASDTVISDLWNRTKGNLIPFIFCGDSTDTGNDAERSYLFARFGQDSLNMTQVANSLWSMKFRIEEEF